MLCTHTLVLKMNFDDTDDQLDVLLGNYYLAALLRMFPRFYEEIAPDGKVSYTKLCKTLEQEHKAIMIFKYGKPHCLRFGTDADKLLFMLKYADHTSELIFY